MTLDEIRSNLAALRGSRAIARNRLERAAGDLAAVRDEQQQAEMRARLEQRRLDVSVLRDREAAEGAFELDPRQWMEQLDGTLPILLFPLRMQTRFAAHPGGRDLLVRVFPDDVSVQSHDPVLTEAERDVGNQFWAAPETSDEPKTKTRPAIWRGMAARYGLRRAAWVMRAAHPDAPAPVVADASLRVPAAWTLPERLVLRLYGHGGQLLREVVGGTIPDGLEMGFDQTRDSLGFERAAGDFEYPPELLWQTDFDAAVKVGMAMRVGLDAADNVDRIERLVVLGVRLGTDPNASAALVEQLVDSHRYTEGFSILPQGTPTNVTGDGDAAAPADADTVLARLRGEGAYADAGRDTLYEDECDGLRLAHALGISPEAMRYVEGAEQRDASEAIAMKRALWAGTLGYYAQQMLWPLFESDNAAEPPGRGERLTAATRFHFTHFVFGRGPLPAIRVGDQPYGILPVSGDMLGGSEPGVPPWNELFVDGFETALHGKLLILAKGAWLDPRLKLARAGPGPDADQRLVEVLSLQASSVQYHGERLVGKETLKNFLDYQKQGAESFFVYEELLVKRYEKFLLDFPALFPTQPAVFDLSFFGGYWKQAAGGLLALDRSLAPLLTGDVVDDLPYSETRPIDDNYPNYLAGLATLAFADVRRGLSRVKGGATVPVTALLYLLARHSHLCEHAFTMMRLHHQFQNKPWANFREKELYNVLFVPDTTTWDTLDEKARWPELSPGVRPKLLSALELIAMRADLRERFADWKTYFGDVDEQQRALGQLAKLPTARLERLFAEHLDLAGYRLDAWITGFVYQRLLAARAWRQQDRANRVHPMYPGPRDGPLPRYDLNHRPLAPYASGLYLGAYGWVEAIDPDAPSTPVDDLPGDLAPRNGKPVTRDADNHGLVQAPSLNQANTAALLRAASVTQPGTSAFNIDLSSARVRDALWIIDGVRNGQTPAALLGYQLERGLRERDVKLLRHLPKLRAAFPMPRVSEAGGEPAEAVPARDVVNGLRVVQALRDGTLGTQLAVIDDGDRPAVAALAAKLVATFDACSDLMLAESVHQAALGNFDRAGGIVTAAGEFMHVPDEFEVIQTQRSGTGLTHRLLLAMNDGAAVPGTPRARLAPALNAWLGQAIGPLSAIACGVAYTFDADGAEQSARHTVPLAALGLEPLDLLYLLDRPDENTASEFGMRVDAAARPPFDAAHPDAVVQRVELELFAAVPAGIRAVGELMPLIASLRALVAAGRTATRRDLLAPQALHGLTADAVDAIDMPELAGRVSALKLAFEAAIAALGPVAGLDAAGLRAALLDAASFGIAQAVPAAAADFDALAAQAARVTVAMQARLEASARPMPPTSGALGALGGVVVALLGAAVPLMPRIAVANELAAAALAPDDPAPERVEDWLFTASMVREGAARLQHARGLAAVSASELAPLRLFQWPAQDKRWIAEPNSVDAARVRDYLALAVQPGAALDLAQPLVGLVVDEWHELIPNATETTGISFHYDAPNAEPPQALLLAVAERRRATEGNWSWDELTRCVEQSLQLAKLRAVGPDDLRHTKLDAVLPATLAAEAATPATISTSFLANLSTTVAKAVVDVWSRM